MGERISIAYMALYVWAGIGLARRCLPSAGALHTIPVGCGIATAMLAMLPAAAALGIGFTAPAAFISGVCVGASGVWAWCKHDNKLHENAVQIQSDHKQEWLCMLVVCLPAFLLTVYLLYTHVLRYEPANGAYYTGQSGYGDTAMHLAFIKNIAVSGKMPPHYSLLAGQEVFGYPFLCESVSSVFLLFGAGLKFAYILPCIPALVSIFGGVWLLARQVLQHPGKATLASLLFIYGAGLGFLYFLGSKEQFASIFTGYYTTPTNFVERNLRWVNCIADLLVPQRATLMGWALAMPALYLLYRFAFQGEKHLWLALGLLAGSMPLMQTHSLLMMVIVSAVYLCRPAKEAIQNRSWASLRPWIGYAATAGALCIPQLCGVIFRQTSGGNGFLQPVFNWVNNGTGENFFWFYIKNIGIVYILMIPAFLWADKSMRRLFLGGFVVKVISELVVFQPNYYDNIKLLYFWFLLTCILVAGAVWDWISHIHSRPAKAILAAAVVSTGTLSGILTLGREAISNYQVFNASGIALAEYVDENTAPDAVFLTGRQHLNPVASLAGRQIICGSSLYVYFHGMHFEAQDAAVREMYETPTEELLHTWNVDYVMYSSYERNDYQNHEDWYAQRYPVWFRQGEYTIYQITE